MEKIKEHERITEKNYDNCAERKLIFFKSQKIY